MESADFLLRPTISERTAWHGVKSALLTCKHKTINLLARGTDAAPGAVGGSHSPETAESRDFSQPRELVDIQIAPGLTKIPLSNS